MNGSSQFCFHRDHSRMSERHQEPALVFRELKPKCCFVLTRFQVFEVQGTEFWKPQAALGFGSSHTDSEEQCLEKCECPLCVGTVTVLSACPWRPLGVTKGPRKLTLSPSSTGNLIFGLLISGISSCLTSLNFWITILNLRSYYLTLKTIPLFPWAFLITAFMLLLTLPILSGTLLLILGDLHFNTLFFDPILGGDPIFYQHLFWFFGHPEVYILIIPAFGIISIIISGILQLIIFGNQSMIFAMSSISLLGSLVWGHHMYTVGLESDTRAYFTGVTILISLPTGTKIFNWLFTYLGNPPLLHLRISSVFFSHLFLLMFTIGGSTGIILGNAAVDLGLHDTYYVVAHFHFVLSLGAIIAIFSGIIFNGEKIVGTKNLLLSSSSTLSLFHLHLIFIGILLTFSPMHFLGFNVMPRRIPSFPDSFNSWNSLSSIGSGITFLSFGCLCREFMS